MIMIKKKKIYLPERYQILKGLKIMKGILI